MRFGAANMFVGKVTVAHAAVIAGARQVLYSLWPIRPQHGAALSPSWPERIRATGQPSIS